MLPRNTALALTLSALALVPRPARAAADPVEDGRPAVRVFTDRDGLPQNSIFSIARDGRGYIWVATRDGAARYNGRTWTPVPMPQSERSSLVWSVVAASDGAIWFGRHGGGVSRLKDGSFTTWDTTHGLPSGQVYVVREAVSADGTSVMWAGTEKGLARFDGKAWKAEDVPAELRGQPVLSLLAAREEGMDVLWVGSAAGLARRDAAGWTWLDARSGLPRAAVRSLLRVDRDGRSELWIGTEGGGVARLVGGRVTVFGKESGLENLTVYALLESRGPDGAAHVWAGTYGAGLARWDGARFTHTSDGIPSNVVKSLLDTSAPGGPQVLWAGTETGGLARLERGSFIGLQSASVPLGGSVYALLTTQDDGGPSYWVGAYTDGVMRHHAGAWSAVATPMPSKLISSLEETTDADGSRAVWIGTFGGGLGRLANGRWTVFEAGSGLPHNRITKLLASRTPGRLWIGTYGGGLACFEDGRFTVYDRTSGLPSDRVQSLLETPGEGGATTLWVGTEFGLARLEGGKWTVYDARSGLPNDLVVSLMLEEPAGRRVLWAGTLGGGVARMDLGTPGARFEAPRLSAPLASKAVYQIRRDARGRVYLFTSRGVARLTPRRPTPDDRAEYLLRTFTTEDGLPSNECNFNATMTDARGRLWVGTSHGVGVLDPSLNVDDTAKKPLLVESVAQGSRALTEASAQELSHRENGLEFSLALLSYSHDAETTYRTQLVGFDGEPSPWTPEHKRTYTNLPAGRFVFTAWGRDYAGNVSGPVTFPLRVHAAPWRTPWAYAAYALLLLGVAWSVHRLRLSALERKNRELAARVAEGTRELGSKVAELERSERRAQELAEKAQEASRAKSVFLASMSHELRTPLSAVIGFAQLLERDERMSGRSREELAIIQRSGEHLLGLIEDVLSLSRIEAGRLTLSPQPFDLRGMLASVEGMVRPRADAKDLELVFDVAAGVPARVVGDEGRLRQVLLNLLGNAVKFTSRGSVRLDVRAAGEGRVRFEVEDTGPGISDDERARLFRPFGQTEAGIASQEGTGLGLVISRQIVRMMGGDVMLESRPGTGSRFSFDVALPATDAPLPARTRREVLGLAAGQAPVRVLVVDDAHENRLLLSRLLEGAGFEVREAADGRQAVEETERFRPHVVFMDKRMPELDGVEATRLLRRSDAGRAARVVFLTASTFEHEAEELRAAGADTVLAKPFRTADVFETIAALLPVSYRYEDGDARAEAPRAKVLDEAAGLRRAGGNRELYESLVSDLRADLRGVVARLRAAPSPAAFSDELHRVKGVAATLGADALAAAASALEREARTVPTAALAEGASFGAFARAVDELLGA